VTAWAAIDPEPKLAGIFRCDAQPSSSNDVLDYEARPRSNS
jgi:hypothetical protein